MPWRPDVLLSRLGPFPAAAPVVGNRPTASISLVTAKFYSHNHLLPRHKWYVACLVTHWEDPKRLPHPGWNCVIGRLRDARSHVVVGTDFSEGAAEALAEAQQISRHFRSPLTLVHATSTWTERLCETDLTAIAWLRSARVRPDRVLTRTGLAWSVLARTAEELGAGLIVIGSHGRSGYQPLELGSTAARISLIAPCPVLIIGPRARRHTVSKARATPGNQHRHPSREAELHD